MDEQENKKEVNTKFLNELEKKLKNKKGPKKSPTSQNKGGNKLTLFIFLGLLAVTIFYLGNSQQTETITEIAYSEFIKAAENNNITTCTIYNEKKIVFELDGIKRKTIIPLQSDNKLLPMLLRNNIEIVSKIVKPSIYTLLFNFVSFLLCFRIVIIINTKASG